MRVVMDGDNTAVPGILLDHGGLLDRERAGAGQGVIRARLSKHVWPIVAIAILSFLLYELATAFLGYDAPVMTAARVLFSVCAMLAASCFWSNMKVIVLRMLLPRARYSDT